MLNAGRMHRKKKEGSERRQGLEITGWGEGKVMGKYWDDINRDQVFVICSTYSTAQCTYLTCCTFSLSSSIFLTVP